jgi:hypothetical protein
MKILFTHILIFISSFTFAQFAIVQDKDGYCNVRDSADIAANIKDKLNNGHFVYVFQKKDNWMDIGYTKNKADLSGFIYHDRLQLISHYQSIPAVTKTANSVTLVKDSLRVVVSQQNFVKSKNKLSYYKETKDQVELVNGQTYWGTDGGMPSAEYKSIVISIGKRKLVLPKAALANLFQPRLSSTGVNYDKANDILYVQASNSDGAGFHEVIWRIEKGIYKDRYVASGF